MRELPQTTHLQRPSETLVSLISERLAQLAALFPASLKDGIEPITRNMWVNALKFLTPTQIAAGFDRIEQSFVPTAACPFPVPAQLMAVISDAYDNATQIFAERAWEDLLLWMQRYYRPDCKDKTYPLMQSKMAHAASAAGGLEHISSCPIKELVWAKKKFVGAYLNLAKLEQDKPLLAPAEVMKQVGAVAERKQLK